MNEMISNLLEYQKADLAVEAAEKKVKSCDERKNANRMKQRFDTACEERKRILARQDETEKEIAAITAEVDKLLAANNVDRTADAPEDVDAIKLLVEDIDKQMKALTRLEDKLNKINTELTENGKILVKCVKIANEAKEEFNKYKADYEKILEVEKPEIDRLKAVRDGLAGNVDKTLMAKYQSLRQNKIVPTARLNNSSCGGCGMGMPAFTVSNANKYGYCECENCGRIVYVE